MMPYCRLFIKRLVVVPALLILLQQTCFGSPVLDERSSSTSQPILNVPDLPRALKMLGPVPLAPGQRGTVKTDYFDPKTYSTKDLRDFHRLTQGLNADIRRMVEETERIRQKSVEDAEELSRLRDWAHNGGQKQWLMLITLSALAVALLALALANLLLIKTSLKLRKPTEKPAGSLLLDSSA